jgi:hypothetical protein
MTRAVLSRPVLSTTLVLVLLTSISQITFVGATSAAPRQETARNSASITTSITSPADEVPGPRFPFSVLDQAATTITKTICPTPATCAGGGTNATLRPGELVSFLVTVVNAQRSPVTITDFWQAGLVFQDGAGCGTPTSTTAPGFVAQVTCSTTSSQIVLNFLVSTTATSPSTAINQACAPSNAAGDPTCSQVTVHVGIPGDFNGDGFVDIRDYGIWRQNFGQTNCGNPADADFNCMVDIRDYGIWRQHFGEGTP